MYPETKHPSYFESVGLALEEPLADALRRHGLDRPNAQVFVQSFETANLRRLDAMVRVPLVQLVAASGAPYDLVAFLGAGVDGVFSDHPDTALVAREDWHSTPRRLSGVQSSSGIRIQPMM